MRSGTAAGVSQSTLRAVDLFQGVLDAADEAERIAGGKQAHLDVAGNHVTLRGAGALIDRLLTAVEHLRFRPAGASPDLGVRIVDTASTGVALPPAPWAAPPFLLPRGQVPGFSSGRVRAAYDPTWHGLSLVDLDAKQAVLWAHDAAVIAPWEVAAPLRTVLHWWLPVGGTHLLHAGAVGTPDGAVLLVGPGGSGKSTAALASMLHGLRYLGDDYVAVGQVEGRWTVFNIYRTGKLVGEHLLSRLPALKGSDRLDGHEDKETLLLDERSSNIEPRLPIRLIVAPVIAAGGRTQVSSTTGAAALRALAPSTIFQQPGDDRAAFAFMARMVADLPCVRLELGDDVERVAPVIRQAITEAAG